MNSVYSNANFHKSNETVDFIMEHTGLSIKIVPGCKSVPTNVPGRELPGPFHYSFSQPSSTFIPTLFVLASWWVTRFTLVHLRRAPTITPVDVERGAP